MTEKIFGGLEDTPFDQLPRDIKDSLGVIMGHMPDPSSEGSHAPKGQKEQWARGPDGQPIGKIKGRTIQRKIENLQVCVFDMSDEKDRAKYADILSQVTDSKSSIVFAEPPREEFVKNGEKTTVVVFAKWGKMKVWEDVNIDSYASTNHAVDRMGPPDSQQAEFNFAV